MRLFLVVLACLAMLPFASGDHPYGCGCYCPTYHEQVDAGPVGVSLGRTSNGFGAILLEAGDHYIAEDYLYVNDIEHLGGFSIYFYEESNGVPGMQRGDEQCVDTPPGAVPDTLIY